ncbi:RNA methyltransferase-like protein 1 [Asbolus verrucosus]|uniref:RNA methyltransferase-like protein 1 n=1 Tax=Asbolus verrucosus TaxID=1661398 RepID=A0A482VBG2_ASBVE|nr:RNA methyltransferase-like protein 1 [Asbolus verrucosus]
MSGAINNFIKTALKSKLISQQVRFYPRWSHRRPLKVYTAEEYDEMEKKQQSGEKPKNEKQPNFSIFEKYGNSKINWDRAKDSKEGTSGAVKYKIKPKKMAKPLIATHQSSKIATTDMLETVIDGEGNFVYTKMGNNDRRVGTILTEIKSKKEKNKKDLILLEGKRLIKDALQSGCHLKYILFSRKNEIEYLKPFLPKVGVHLYKMPYKEMQMWSDLTTNPGIMGIFKIPNIDDFKRKEALPFTVICDNIREPGNLGTILRICAAVGCDKVILTKGCVNLWDTKVLRSSVGAHFKLRIQRNQEWHKIEEEIDASSNIFIADNRIISDSDGNTEDLGTIMEQIPVLPYYGIDFKSFKHTILIVGGETLGISKNSYEIALKMSGMRLNIPLSNDVESLNVGAALGIIAFEFRKQLMQTFVNK